MTFEDQLIGETLSEMVEMSGLEHRTLERRVQRAGIKAITREALYPVGTYEKIKDADKVGRPRKNKSETEKPTKKQTRKKS